MNDTERPQWDRSKLLIEFDPPQFLLSSETVTRIVGKYVDFKNREAEGNIAKERAISIGISFVVSIFCSFETLFGTIPQVGRTLEFGAYLLRALAMAGIALWLGWCVYRYWKCRKAAGGKPLDIQAEMKTGAKENVNYTAILIIAIVEESGVRRLFVDGTGQLGRSFFLPYCSMDKQNTIHYQGERIKTFLSERYGLHKQDILEVVDLSEEPTFSIKATRTGTVEKQHAFAFFRICLAPGVRKVFDKLEGGWYTIDELKKNPQALERNGDVINKLDECPEYIADSFEGKKHPPLKIIWNITNACGYQCGICATHDQLRKELSLGEKLVALQSILTIKEQIGVLDFAGGDPCYSEDSPLIVQQAIHALGRGHVSVTTTGMGIKALDDKRRKALLKHCEITIDAERAENDHIASRAADGYVESNVDELVTYGDAIQQLTINVPIINTDLSDTEIEHIVNKIRKIKDANKNIKIQVSFLRLMPVGKAGTNQYPEAYSPWGVMEKIRRKLEPSGIACASHCSLNVCRKSEAGDGCGRLKTKLGIDCAGNVFACAWAGYLTGFSSVEDNPFYIGNLLETDLNIMLSKNNQNRNYRKMSKYNPKEFDFCPLISLYNGSEPIKNNDPLSESVHR